MTEREMSNKAIKFANSNKKFIAKKLTCKEKFPSETYPVSVFMAGSPGAGKTESAKELIKNISINSPILRIDADEVRSQFEDYDGSNSSLFQASSSILIEKMHDMALKNNQSFVFDGTLYNFNKTVQNIERSHHKGREVFIVYVYQDPVQAWEFVKERSMKEGMSVPKQAFIKQYFAARGNVNKIKEMFKDKVQIDIVVKNIDGSDFKYKENIIIVDSHIKEKYSEETLNSILE